MKKTLNIEGMSCGHCANHVKTALSELNGVDEVVVSLEDKNALVQLSSEVGNDVLSNAVKEVGYEVTSIV